MYMYVFQGGVYVYQLVDWYLGAVACYVIAILECVAVGWCYGRKRYNTYSYMLTKASTVFLIIYPSLL